jgi:large subunit ribosomal protein L6
MSRVGKLPIIKPSDVTVTIQDHLLTVKGPKGTLTRSVRPEMDIEIDQQAVRIKRRDDSRESRALHGLTRALVYNMVHGVSKGFTRVLEIAGTGYKADVSGNVLTLSLGYSHPVPFMLPDGIKAAVERTTVIRLEGIDKELLGQTAARIRAVRAVEPYKGKGVRYSDERVHRKAGKTGKK